MPTRAPRILIALAAVAAALALGGCENPEAEKKKQCEAALADTERLIKEQDLRRARDEQAKAAKMCPPTLQDRVLAADQKITTLEAKLKKLREAQDEAEKKKAEKEKKLDRGEAPVIGKHSSETGATGHCKTYVDCLCGIADRYRYKTGHDAHRGICKDAKKVLAGRNAQEGCQKLLKEMSEQDESWKAPYETQGVEIPSMCP